MEETTTIPPEAVYHPFTQQEFIDLDYTMQSITNHLPDNKMGYVWSNYNRIRGVNETQPCGCASAAGHWLRAVNELKQWIASKK